METVLDICRELERIKSGQLVPSGYVRDLAPRLRAALKRERKSLIPANNIEFSICAGRYRIDAGWVKRGGIS